jgi:hypothetical protein
VPIDTLVTSAVTVPHRLGGSSAHWVMLVAQMQCVVAKFVGSFRVQVLTPEPRRRPVLRRRR